MHRAQSLLAYHQRPLLLMLWRRCACKRANKSATPYIFFLPRHRHRRPRPGYRQAFPLRPAGFGGGDTGTFLCSAVAKKHRRTGGECCCVFLIAKLFPDDGKHLFLLSFCNFPSKNKYMKSSNKLMCCYSTVSWAARLILMYVCLYIFGM